MSRREEKDSGAGAGKKTASGRERGKAAAQSIRKTLEWVSDYLEILEGAKDASAVERACDKAQSLARVVKAPGGRHLEVTLQDGTHEKAIPIAKSIGFHGKASKKAEEANCLGAPGSVVLLHGGFAVGKLSGAGLKRAEAAFARLGMSAPSKFFAPPISAGTSAVAEVIEEVVEWDRGLEAEEEAEELAKLKAEKKRAQEVHAGIGAKVASEEEESSSSEEEVAAGGAGGGGSKALAHKAKAAAKAAARVAEGEGEVFKWE